MPGTASSSSGTGERDEEKNKKEEVEDEAQAQVTDSFVVFPVVLQIQGSTFFVLQTVELPQCSFLSIMQVLQRQRGVLMLAALPRCHGLG